MKICMVSDSYFPEPGGIAEHIYHLGRELRGRGHDVRVLTAVFRGSSQWQSDDEQFVFRVGRSVRISANQSSAQMTIGHRLGRQVRELFERERFDVVHVHGSLAPMLPLTALSQSRAINVATFHAGHERSAGYRVFRTWLGRYFRRLHGRIAVSEAARLAMAEYFPAEYRIIPNGIDIDVFRPAGRPANGRAPTILFLGRFDPRKGLDLLLQALPRVQEAVPDVRCVAVGPGNVRKFRRNLDPAVRDAVEFPGPVFGRARVDYYTGCDVFCSPATGRESFGIILLEAMACARPVVASDIEGYREVVSNDTDGLLVPPRDPAALADALIRILQDRTLASRLGAAGLDKARGFAWPGVADQVEAYYRELTGQGAGSAGS